MGGLNVAQRQRVYGGVCGEGEANQSNPKLIKKKIKKKSEAEQRPARWVGTAVLLALVPTRVGLRGPVRRPRVTPGGTGGGGGGGLDSIRPHGRVPPIRSSPQVLAHRRCAPPAAVPAGGIWPKNPTLPPFSQRFFGV